MPTAILIWVWFCAYLNCAGWTLSALHQLNAAGYMAALLIGFVAFAAWWRQSSGRNHPQISWRKLKRRFRRPLPLAFLILAAMACLGGVLHAPSNYDALAYRVPRVLHWLAADQWHWIHAVFPRVNTRSCGIEWVSAPFIALLKTDRLLFLINVVSFLLMPGLVFSVFTRLGVRPRVAWHWMWIVPTGYCYLLQVGGTGSDLFGAVFALASVDFALRTKHTRSARDFFTSALAVALTTAAKTPNLPLLLPWAVAVLPCLGLMKRWPLRTAVVGIMVLMASILPTAILNLHYCGDWSGWRLEAGGAKLSPAFLAGANTGLISLQNLVPPVFPFDGRWHDILSRLPRALCEQMDRGLESGVRTFDLPQLQMEENAGLGFGVCVLLIISAVAARVSSSRSASTPRAASWQTLVRWSPLVSLLFLMTQSNATAVAREITPYYALVLPILLAKTGHERLVRRRWWRTAALAVFPIAAGLLIVSPARPLFPMQTILEKMPNVPARQREVYSVYHERNDAFAPVRAVLPPDVKVLGLITYDDPETSLWRPFGSRRIEHVCPQDTAADLKRRGIEYILVRPSIFGAASAATPEDWCRQMNAEVVRKIPLNLRAARGALDWYLVKLN
jgi:hypothetical protein